MNKIYYIAVCLLFTALSAKISLYAQENVYISTDKEYYLAGESIWYSAYCLDGSGNHPGSYSKLSSIAYIEFHNPAGVVTTIKTGLIDGRGCGKFEIPFSFPTGNYSIVAYTKHSGGNSKGEYRGKIVTIFNTLTNERIKDMVEVVENDQDLKAITNYIPRRRSRDIEIEIGEKDSAAGKFIPVRIRNTGGKRISFNISVYHKDELSSLIGENGYDNTNLLDRKGEFEFTDETDYEGEVIKGRIRFRNNKGAPVNMSEKNVYMSAIGGIDDIYISKADSSGNITYYTGNIYGQRDLVFDVTGNKNITKISDAADTTLSCYVEIINKQYNHKPEKIPVLKISTELSEALSERSMKMQIAKRFEADTIFDLLKFRKNPLLGDVKPSVYNLDEYTRFPLMEEVVREFVKELRIRKFEGNSDFQVLITEGKNAFVYSEGYTLALLDGVPVRDHSKLVELDPLLVKQIVIYRRRFTLGSYMCDGIVEFNTYKGDMGGLKLTKNINIVNYKGVQYPLAFSGNAVSENKAYPNYNETIYWNPVADLKNNDTFEFRCLIPEYKGEFRIVIEGIDEKGGDIYSSAVFSL